MYDVESDEIEYRATMDSEDDNISIGFQPVPPQLIDTNNCRVEAGPIQPISPKIANLSLDCTPIMLILISKLKHTGSLSNLTLRKKPI